MKKVLAIIAILFMLPVKSEQIILIHLKTATNIMPAIVIRL
jgi:hypothetical protein